jgi:hypothetical protein
MGRCLGRNGLTGCVFLWMEEKSGRWQRNLLLIARWPGSARDAD